MTIAHRAARAPAPSGGTWAGTVTTGAGGRGTLALPAGRFATVRFVQATPVRNSTAPTFCSVVSATPSQVVVQTAEQPALGTVAVVAGVLVHVVVWGD